MRRYDLGSPHMGGGMEPHPTGDWIPYDDAAALVEAAYREALLDADCVAGSAADEMWTDSNARAALARKEESDG